MSLHNSWYPSVTLECLLAGVIETGLFVGMVQKVFFGMPDGSVLTRLAPALNGNGSSDSGAEH